MSMFLTIVEYFVFLYLIGGVVCSIHTFATHKEEMIIDAMEQIHYRGYVMGTIVLIIAYCALILQWGAKD